MRELSCFGDGSVSVAAAAAASVSGRGALDRSLQAATTSVYRAVLSSGKEMLVRVTWTRSAAGAAGVAVAFDDDGDTASAAAKPSAARSGQARDLSRRLGLGTAAPVPRGGRGAVLVSRREQLRGAAAAHVTRCRFREGGEEHEVAVHACRGGDGELRVSIDGEKMAEVRRLGWGFRGNRAAVLADGEVVDVMWDVHDWWFGGRGASGAGAGAQFMVKARAEKEGRLWMADEAAARGQSPGGFFLHVQCYRR
ncbi:hypothetical protein BAE44_0019555 [Dichanthelium oligosanthes]|uniref:DUF868 domain-containing protein n=1 Tax=Dichanthelium oligosanthes TaxID=888268 RepID=A0A1E5V2Z4_9POAL|nr:hypothetical protein BAE44_0019555 [Dichanthelium oligosanthes]